MKKNFIDGQWVSADNCRPNINPSDTNDIIAEFASSSAEDTDTAIAAAQAAFPGWRSSTGQFRADILEKVGQTLLARSDELGELLAREEGKTKAEGVGEVIRAAQIFKFFAGEAIRLHGETGGSVRPGVSVEITRNPIGVIGIITPWNFPIAIPAWKIAPALAYGNCVVFKPADLVPGSAHALAEIIVECGIPGGVFNLVMGKGRTVGGKMLEDRRINAVSFTGSQQTGAHVLAQTSARGAKCQLEMGGKNPLIVLDDADLAVAVECAVQGAFFSTGQRCTASSRLIVEAGIHDEFVDAVAARVNSLVIGHALHADTQIGPVVDQSQLDQDMSYIEKAKSEGGDLVCGGELVARSTPGFYLTPALFASTTADMTINREEVFGPVASIIKVDGYEEALAQANNTEFGLSAGICTTSLKAARHFKQNAEAGMVMVNLPTAGVDYHVPFGGIKGSSFGSREQGSYAIDFYTSVKTAYETA